MRIECYLDDATFIKLVNYQVKHQLANKSKAIRRLMNEFFQARDEQDIAVARLNGVIQKQQIKIQNLEYELREKRKNE